MKFLIRLVLILLLVASFIGTFIFLYQKSQEKPVHYKTQMPALRDIVRKTVATGSILPRKEIKIKPQISGLVDEVFVEAGDLVKQGDLIVRVKVIPEVIALNKAKSQLKQAQIVFKDVEKTYHRKRDLYRRSLIAEELFQVAQLSYDKAQEELKSAKNHLQLIEEGVTQNKGTPTNTLIRSTIDGMVLEVPVKQGHSLIGSNNFNEGTTVATVADMSEMIFEGKIDESDVGKLEIGMKLILTIGAIEGETFKASIETVAPKGVPENGTVQFKIRAKIELKASHFIRAGYSANADIILERKTQILTINESVLQFEGDKPYVEVETQPQQFERRAIAVGLSDGIHIEILEGLTQKDRVKVPRS